MISACGSTAPAGTGSGSSGGNNTAADVQEAVKFAKCMRSNGVGEFPDPGASGKFTIDGIANGSSLDPSTPTFKQAISACKSLEPAGFMGGKRSRPQVQAALEFAQCIRENGVNDFPDPVNGQPLVDTGERRTPEPRPLSPGLRTPRAWPVTDRRRHSPTVPRSSRSRNAANCVRASIRFRTVLRPRSGLSPT